MHKLKLIGVETRLEHIAQPIMETQQDHMFVLDKEEKMVDVVPPSMLLKKHSNFCPP